MKIGGLIFFSAMIFVSLSMLTCATPFIVGRVNDSLDGVSANGKTMVLWNPNVGINDNVTDTIGPTGNSGVNNIFLIDCDLLTNGCTVGMNISLKVVGSGGRVTNHTNLTINGAGFQQTSNLVLNSLSVFNSTSVDDSITSPAGEIDLSAGSNITVTCQGTIYDPDGEGNIINVTSTFFDNVSSFYSDSNDNNHHYTNSTCSINYAYGTSTEVSFSCQHNVKYYANSANWNCTGSAGDYIGFNYLGSNTTFINPLLAIEVPSVIDYGHVNSSEPSPEITVNVTNFGNVMLNLSLEGYARSQGDNYSMNCSSGFIQNISVGHQKFNLTATNAGSLNLAQFTSLYTNLSGNRTVNKFGLNYRRSDIATYLDDTNATYWRIYVPSGAEDSCSGNIIFGAARSSGI